MDSVAGSPGPCQGPCCRPPRSASDSQTPYPRRSRPFAARITGGDATGGPPARPAGAAAGGRPRVDRVARCGPWAGGVTVLLLSNLGTFVIRIRILCIVHVSCMYFDVSRSYTSRYIKIHQDTFVSFTLAIIGNVSYLGICILLYDTFRIHSGYIQDTMYLNP